MRWILKIILFPISLLLSILTAVLSFLLSPYGIPMVGASIIALLQGINEKIMSV